MRELIEKALSAAKREDLEKSLRAIPDMPENLRQGIDYLSDKQLAALLAKAIGDGLLSTMGDGFLLYVKKNEPSPFCFKAKETILKATSKVFGNDNKMIDRCLQIARFIKDKGGSEKLSTEDFEELKSIQMGVVRVIKEKYPDLSKDFAGFKLAEDQEEILLRFSQVKTYEFDDPRKFGDALKKRGFLMGDQLAAFLEKNYE